MDPQNQLPFKKRLPEAWKAERTEKAPKVLLGGFLNIQDTNEKIELLLSANDLNVDKAVEYAKQIYIAKQKEERSRKAAENKALFAIQQAKASDQKTHESIQQLAVEHQLRLKKEAEITYLQELLQEKDVLQKEADTKIQLLTLRSQEFEAQFSQKLQAEIHKKSAEILHEAEQRIKAFEEKNESKIRQIEFQKSQKIKQAEEQSQQKIKEAENKIHFHEKAKISAQGWIQKHLETIQQIEAAKDKLQKKLEFEIQAREALQDKINQIEQQNHVINTEKTCLINQITSSLELVKKMESILLVEKSLRKAMDEKMASFNIREEELKRKALEDKVLAVTKTLCNTEMEKLKVDEKLLSATEDLQKLEIMLNSERNIKKDLEEQLQEIVERMGILQKSNQDAISARQTAEQRTSVLLNEKLTLEQMHLKASETHQYLMRKISELEQIKRDALHDKQSIEQKMQMLMNTKNILEQEKIQNKEKIERMQEAIQELELLLETEKYLRKEAEKTRVNEEQIRKIAQEKISMAIEQANKTVLNVLGNLSFDAVAVDTIERI